MLKYRNGYHKNFSTVFCFTGSKCQLIYCKNIKEISWEDFTKKE